MSIWHAGSWVMQLDGVTPIGRHLLTTLFLHKNFKTGQCNPSQETLARETGYSDRCIRKHLKDLEDQGLIVRVPVRRADGTRGSDNYQINFDQDEWELVRKERKTKRHEVPVDAQATGTSCQDNRNVVPEQPERGSGKQVLEHQEEQNARAREASAGEPASRAALPACTVWRENEARIIEHLGPKIWKSWLSTLTPHADNGEALVLAAPSRFIADYVTETYAEQLGKLLSRQVRCQHATWAGPAARDREARQDREASHARRDPQ